MRKNDPITIGYGHIKLVVRDVSEDSLKCQILISGHIFNKKTIYLPDSKINYPKELTEQDKRDLNFAAENKANFVSIPYVCDGKKIKLVRQFLRDKGLENPFIIAKIECEEALINFRQILDETDSILVSRGPLGEEIDLETVTLSQKMIIRKCNVAGKPVITATQMLESMRVNPFPTRAEASDVGNAVFDGTDCVMLS
ncbi:Pyruvate kinase, partial [Bonamia ostreae]